MATKKVEFSAEILKHLDLFRLIFPDEIDTYNAILEGEKPISQEVRVISPFPRSYTQDGTPIFEETKSASVNLVKGVFYDAGKIEGDEIGSGRSLLKLFQELKNIPNLRTVERLFKAKEEVKKTINLDNLAITTDHLIQEYQTKHLTNPSYQQLLCQQYHISLEVAKDLRLFKEANELFSIPVYNYQRLVDIRTYNPYAKLKVLSLKGAKAGFIVGEEQ